MPEIGSGAAESTYPSSLNPERLHLLNHDIRSAMSDVLGGLNLVDLSSLSSDAVLQIERVRAAATAAGRLYEELLAEVIGEPVFTMALAGDHRAPLLDVLREIEQRWAGHAAGKGLALQFDIATDLPILINVDPGALERTLSNLMSNALKFSQSGTIVLRADLPATRDLRFVIEDTGPGFSQEALARVFEYGGRPDNSDQPGSGIGLHICKELADRMGGQLYVSNLPTGGAQVGLILPASAWQAEWRVQNKTQMPDLSGRSVLLAEDNATNQVVIGQLLRQMGADVMTVADGQAAQVALTDQRFDIALVDINMPHVCGADVIKFLRALPGDRGGTPVLAVTAYVMRNDREKIYRAGADGILAKPIMNTVAFGQAVASLIEMSKLSDVPEPASPPKRSQTQDLTSGQMHLDRARLTAMLEMAGPDMQEELLRRLDRDLGQAAAKLSDGIAAQDVTLVRAQTHILISLTGAIASPAILDLVRAANDAAHGTTEQAIEPLAAPLTEAIGHLMHELRAFNLERVPEAQPI